METPTVLYSFVGTVTTEHGARLTAVARVRAKDGFPREAFEAAADATADLIGHRPDPKTGVRLTKLDAIKSMDDIQRAVSAACAVWGVSEPAIFSKCRVTSACKARFAVYQYLCVTRALGASEVGRLMGRDHGTIWSGVRKFSEWVETDSLMRSQVEEFNRRLDA